MSKEDLKFKAYQLVCDFINKKNQTPEKQEELQKSFNKLYGQGASANELFFAQTFSNLSSEVAIFNIRIDPTIENSRIEFSHLLSNLNKLNNSELALGLANFKKSFQTSFPTMNIEDLIENSQDFIGKSEKEDTQNVIDKVNTLRTYSEKNHNESSKKIL